MQTAKLVQELLLATRAGRVRWQPAGAEGAYRLERPSGTVILSRRVGSGFTLQFLRADGEEVLSHSEGLMSSAMSFGEKGGPRPGALGELYHAVHETAGAPRPEVESFLREL